MANLFEIGVSLVAFDRMSNVIKGATDKSKAALSGMLAGGAISAGILGMVGQTVSSFAELEEASITLKNTLMDSTGAVSPAFAEIDKVAKRLGVALPGTTADFYKMAASLKSLGVNENSIANGTLAAAANLGVVLRTKGVNYEQAAEAAGKFKNALGIADTQMVDFMDTIQKTVFAGADLGQMQYAFSKLSGPLKTLGLQGLDAANDLAPLIAMITREGRSGEETGTALGNIFSVGLKEKLFSNTDGLLKYLDGLQKLDKTSRLVKLDKLFGKGGAGDVAALISTKGLAGYQQINDEMNKQADLQKRVAEATKGLSMVWDSFTGTAQAVSAAIGQTFSDDLKSVIDYFNTLTAGVGKFITENKELVRYVALGAAAFGGLLAGLAGYAAAASAATAATGAITSAMAALELTLAPIGLTVAGAALVIGGAGFLIWKYWEPLKAFFGGLFEGIGRGLRPLGPLFTAVGNIMAKVFAPVLDFLKPMTGEFDNIAAAGQLVGEVLAYAFSLPLKPLQSIYEIVTALSSGKLAGLGNTLKDIWTLPGFGNENASTGAAAGGNALSVPSMPTFVPPNGGASTGGTATVAPVFQITVNGNMTPEVKNDLLASLLKLAPEIAAMVGKVNARDAQKAY